jgi:hypothetical protein
MHVQIIIQNCLLCQRTVCIQSVERPDWFRRLSCCSFCEKISIPLILSSPYQFPTPFSPKRLEAPGVPPSPRSPHPHAK